MGRRLNTSTPTVIQTELVPLDENFTIEANGTLEQWYYDNNSQYAPDRSITPLILTPVLSVADKDSQQSWDNSQVTKSIVSWSVMEENTWVDITSTSALSNYELSGNNLVVHKNVPYSRGVTIRCKVTYIDPRDNGIYITTQETVLLTCNRDSNVVLPQVAITNPSARSFNPLTDYKTVNGVEVQDSQFDFDAIITNSPEVEIQSSDIATYKMNGSGTEEIAIGDGVAPILDIRYLDSETQFNQEFAYRQTANGEKTDEEGAAFISKIKGNTVAWNQLADVSLASSGENLGVTWTVNQDGTIIANGTSTGISSCGSITIDGWYLPTGHKFYVKGCPSGGSDTTFRLRFSNGNISELGSGLIFPSDGSVKNLRPQVLNGTTVNNLVFRPLLFDLTLIYGAGNEPSTVAQFESDYERWFGKPLTYEPYDDGSLKPVLMQSVKTTGFNQWNGLYSTNNSRLDIDGTEVSSNDNNISSYIQVLGNTSYYFKNVVSPAASVSAICWYDSDRNYISGIKGWRNIDSQTITSPENAHYLRVTVFKDTANSCCINISDPAKNGTYEAYEEYLASVPVTSAKGRLLDNNGNPTGSIVNVFPDGLKKAGSVQDEIFVENGVVKAIKRVGSVDLGSLTWTFSTDSSNERFRAIFTSISNRPQNCICPKYATELASSGAEQKDKTIKGGNNVIWVKDDYFEENIDTFKAAMNGVIFYYELATPETYVLDPVQSPFIFKWFGIDENNNEVLAETLPWYVSGQNTSKLKVDAMWGEKINVVLCAMMPTGVLSPSRAYANITWKIPDVDTTVVSQNGSAVRSNTSSMTFGTIVNLKGRNLSDMAKSAHLRFRWVYRKSTTAQETSAGWSQGQSDQITIQASNLRSVRAQDSTLTSTLVFPYVYCLGAWTTNQGTLTGYDKPTTTKNGVTYYRTVD